MHFLSELQAESEEALQLKNNNKIKKLRIERLQEKSSYLIQHPLRARYSTYGRQFI